jgi:hypothetical protein
MLQKSAAWSLSCRCRSPSKFEFVVNMKTDKPLGLDVPYSVQLLADEAIK